MKKQIAKTNSQNKMEGKMKKAKKYIYKMTNREIRNEIKKVYNNDKLIGYLQKLQHEFYYMRGLTR